MVNQLKHFVDSKSSITFVEIPSGEFHGQTIRPFRLGKYPVTNAQYARFLDAMKAEGKKIDQPEYWSAQCFNQPEQPVVGVSWYDAQVYCEWAGCRLPTEAEWEYACRAGTTTEYSFGDDEKQLEEYAWFEKNSDSQTQPVGTKLPNPWGLHDMIGNVWEWCDDWFDPAQQSRVLRGGGWYSNAIDCRSALRFLSVPSNRYFNIGFRVVCSSCVPVLRNSSEERANDHQEGGDHYKKHGATGEQHWDRVARLELDYFQGNITKYVERWRDKGGIQDLKKARHYLDKYIELEEARLAKENKEHASM